MPFCQCHTLSQFEYKRMSAGEVRRKCRGGDPNNTPAVWCEPLPRKSCEQN